MARHVTIEVRDADAVPEGISFPYVVDESNGGKDPPDGTETYETHRPRDPDPPDGTEIYFRMNLAAEIKRLTEPQKLTIRIDDAVQLEAPELNEAVHAALDKGHDVRIRVDG